MSASKYKIGDVVKYTYDPGDPGSGWFLAKIVEIRDSGYVANLVDRGERTPYETNTFHGIHLGEDGPSLELYPPKLGGNLIGVAPVVAEPKFVGPFEADYDVVLDKNGRQVTIVDSDEGTTEDREIAEVLAAALNQYFGTEG